MRDVEGGEQSAIKANFQESVIADEVRAEPDLLQPDAQHVDRSRPNQLNDSSRVHLRETQQPFKPIDQDMSSSAPSADLEIGLTSIQPDCHLDERARPYLLNKTENLDLSIDSDDLAKIANVQGLKRCESDTQVVVFKDRKQKQKKRRKQRQNFFKVGGKSNGDVHHDKDSSSDG